jgi:hypothetical protein
MCEAVEETHIESLGGGGGGLMKSCERLNRFGGRRAAFCYIPSTR